MNPGHVLVVKQGREATLEWRRAHPGEQLDLSEANLSEANLLEADLFGANLIEADLSRANLADATLAVADLTGAELVRANLSWANLSGTDLSGANLSGANLGGANLIRADLSEANLVGANLSGADLSGANLVRANLYAAVFNGTTLDQTSISRALFWKTVVADCDLSEALGLESVHHHGPSTIGLDTIAKSRGNVPESFLRGAGVSDTIITYWRSLVAEPIQFYTCFISYVSEDEAFANRLYADLQAAGVRCWYYPQSSVMGRRVWEDIDRAIRAYDKLVVICSRASVNSPAVLDEIERALNKEHALARENTRRREEAAAEGKQPQLRDRDVLFPVRVDDYLFDGWEHHRKTEVLGRTVGDFLGWDKDIEKYNTSLSLLRHALDPKSWP
jgi:hypothetical protein